MLKIHMCEIEEEKERTNERKKERKKQKERERENQHDCNSSAHMLCVGTIETKEAVFIHRHV